MQIMPPLFLPKNPAENNIARILVFRMFYVEGHDDGVGVWA
jgi:hypothetical protein